MSASQHKVICDDEARDFGADAQECVGEGVGEPEAAQEHNQANGICADYREGHSRVTKSTRKHRTSEMKKGPERGLFS